MTLVEQSGSTWVQIDTKGLVVGSYTLILESFNTLSLAQSTLKTDTITLTVTAVPVSIKTGLPLIVLTAQVASTWVLPVFDGEGPLSTIVFEP